jgi:transporter family protein|uniref:EamA domain-containing protein n=1 Tax=Desulfobacca acetoxidans TaxID=60893 RepID=A0A7C5AKK5_9BACT
MSTWLGFSLVALVLWGLWGVFSKVATGHLGPQAAYLLGILGYLPIIFLLLYETGGRIAGPVWGWVAAGGAGAATAAALYFYYRALVEGPVSIVVPITSLYQVVTVILSYVFLGENLSPRQLAGLVLAVTAVWLLSE